MNLTTLGHYRIVRLLGQGGMGEVFLAEDTRLGRQIAIKVLPGDVAADASRRGRFELEARAVAALNHPNIVTIHSVEEAVGVHFLTMEFVDGRALSELIPRHGLPIDEFLRIAIPLADAVGAAHQKGIVHRDLKPANVMVTEDGRVKVLDFGLAKLRAAPLAEAADVPTREMTGEGHIVGTVSYMSPEQAAGRSVDHRSDVFSLGVVLYEMATGERPFTGDTNVAVMSSVIKDTPPSVTDRNHKLPRALGHVVKTCLQKDPERRYQSAKDARNELQTLKEELASGEMAAAGDLPAPRANRRRLARVALGIGAIVVAVGGYFVLRGLRAPPVGASVMAAYTQLTSEEGLENHPSISPDGKWIVYDSAATGNSDIYLRSVGGQAAINLTKDSPENDIQPAFSPDGERIAFRSGRGGGGVFLMARTGEVPRRVTNFGVSPAWSPDGKQIVFATQWVPLPSNRAAASGLWTASVETGETRQLLDRDGLDPKWSPNGRFVAYWGVEGLESGKSWRDIRVIPTHGGDPIVITADAALDWSPEWAPDGRFLYFASERGGSMNLWRVGIDPNSGRRLADPEPITTPAPYVSGLSFSADRRLVLSSVLRRSNVYQIDFDSAAGSVQGVARVVTSGSRFFASFDLSPDGKRLVLFKGRVGQEDLFIANADGSGMRQLTNDAAFERDPRWSPDGERIAFHSDRSGKLQIWSIAPDGGGLRMLTSAEAFSATNATWSPDGTRVVFVDFSLQHAVVMFDPRRPWSEQTPEVLPPFPGPGTPIFNVQSWSTGGKLAGTVVGGVGLAVYDLATRTYTKVVDGPAGRPTWLGDARILYAVRDKLMMVDVATHRVTEVYAAPRPEGVDYPRITADGRTLYFLQGSTEADIWMVELGSPK